MERLIEKVILNPTFKLVVVASVVVVASEVVVVVADL